jgi:hypothetical protein
MNQIKLHALHNNNNKMYTYIEYKLLHLCTFPFKNIIKEFNGELYTKSYATLLIFSTRYYGFIFLKFGIPTILYWSN